VQPTDEKVQAEQLKQHGDVKEALEKAKPPPDAHRLPTKKSHRVWVGTWAVLFLVFLGLWFLLSAGIISMPSQRVADILRRGSLGLAAVFFVLVVERLAESYFVPRLDNTVARYNLRRILHLLTGLAVALILVTAIFVNWYTAVVSFGLISLILGFALQTPIIGHAIQIDGTAGAQGFRHGGALARSPRKGTGADAVSPRCGTPGAFRLRIQANGRQRQRHRSEPGRERGEQPFAANRCGNLIVLRLHWQGAKRWRKL